MNQTPNAASDATLELLAQGQLNTLAAALTQHWENKALMQAIRDKVQVAELLAELRQVWPEAADDLLRQAATVTLGGGFRETVNQGITALLADPTSAEQDKCEVPETPQETPDPLPAKRETTKSKRKKTTLQRAAEKSVR